MLNAGFHSANVAHQTRLMRSIRLLMVSKWGMMTIKRQLMRIKARMMDCTRHGHQLPFAVNK